MSKQVRNKIVLLEDDTSVSYMLLKNMFDGKEVKLINAKVKTVKLAGNEKLWYDHGSVILRQQSEITVSDAYSFVTA